MAVEQILKSWLQTKYTDNNTLKSRFGSGTTLIVPDTSNSLAQDTDINTLVTSLRKMQTNTYLRHSPLWSSVNINNVAQGDLIAQTKKTDIDNLMTDLLAMCANYSKLPICVHNPNVVTSFTANCSDTSNFTSFTNNASNYSVTTFSQTCFFWGSNYGPSFFSNTTRPYRFETNFSQTTYSSNGSCSKGGGTFSRNSRAVYGNHEVMFAKRFNASFIVKSDRSTTTNTNVVN